MGFLNAFTVLLLFQLAGEAFVLLLYLPIPGPVIGMFLLLAALLLRKGVPPSLESTANGILRHLSLLFIPAGVGVVIHFSRIGSEWLPITVALLASTLITLVVTAFSMRLIHHLLRQKPGDHDG
jgi:holin-like protein